MENIVLHYELFHMQEMMNEYIPSNINLTKKNGMLSVTKGKQPTTTKVRSKLASR